MMAFWTAVRSAVLPMIAVLSNEPRLGVFKSLRNRLQVFRVDSLIQMIRLIARLEYLFMIC